MNHRACTARLATEAGWTVALLMGGQGDPVPLAAGTLPHFDALPMARGRSGAMDLLRSFVVIRRAMVDNDVCELVTLKPRIGRPGRHRDASCVTTRSVW